MIINKRKLYMRIVIPIFILLLATVIICYKYRGTFNDLFIYYVVSSGIKDEQRLEKQLLCDTNYSSLLEVCREILKQVERGDIKPGRYSFDEKSLPQVVLFFKMLPNLAPSYLYIDENNSGRILIEMAGGLSHFGVEAYSEDFKPPSPNYHYGDKMLIPGLWYYDDGFDENPQYYEKKIDQLIEKGKKNQGF